jgi:PEP-CTERM motif
MNSFQLPRLARRLLALVAASLLGVSSASAQSAGYYIGYDGLTTITTGTYAGLANPNYNNLVLLYNHGDHYHGKGVYRYTGPNLGANTAVELNPSNYLPEGANPPILLSAGSGFYDGKLVSSFYAESEFSNLTFDFTDTLDAFADGSPEHVLHNSSGGRWAGLLGDAHVHLVLESVTPGLNIGDAGNLNIMSAPGDDFHLVSGFSPVFWTDANASEGTYGARFRLTDDENLFTDSGTFEFRFEVAAVPEPSSYAALAGLASLGLVAFRRRRR